MLMVLNSPMFLLQVMLHRDRVSSGCRGDVAEGPTAFTLLPETAAICSTNFLVIFQKRCWSPSSANRFPDDGSHKPDNKISTCATQAMKPLSLCYTQ